MMIMIKRRLLMIMTTRSLVSVKSFSFNQLPLSINDDDHHHDGEDDDDDHHHAEDVDSHEVGPGEGEEVKA